MKLLTSGVFAVLLSMGAATGASGESSPKSAGVGQPPQVQVVTDFIQPTPGNPARVLENYEAILKVMDASPNRWAGAYVDGDSLVIRHHGQSNEQAHAAAGASGIYGAVIFRPASVPLSVLSSAKDALSATMQRGSGIVAVSPNYISNGLNVEVLDDSSGLLQEIERLVANPAIPIHVRVIQGSGPMPAGSRWYDTRPYWAGNAIQTSGSGISGPCSTGFNLSGAGDGYQYALTAAHCYTDYGGPVRPAVAIRVPGPTSSQSDDCTSGMGTIWSVSVNTTGQVLGRKGDLAVYRYTPVSGISTEGHGAGYVYEGDGNVTSGQPVRGTSDMPVGFQSTSIRTSGSSGWYWWDSSLGMISPDWVKEVNKDIYYSSLGLTYHDLTNVEDAEECISVGDSGGAVYLKVSNGVRAVGIISGTNNGGGGLSNCENYYSPVKFLWTTATIKLAP